MAAISSSESPRSASEKGCTWPAAPHPPGCRSQVLVRPALPVRPGSPRPISSDLFFREPQIGQREGLHLASRDRIFQIVDLKCWLGRRYGQRRCAWLWRRRRAWFGAEAIAAYLIAAGILENCGVAGIIPDRSGTIPVQVGPIVDAAPSPQPYSIVCSKQERREHKLVFAACVLIVQRVRSTEVAAVFLISTNSPV